MRSQESPLSHDPSGVEVSIAESPSSLPRDNRSSAARPVPFARATGHFTDDPSARLARTFRYPSIRALFPYALWLQAGAAGMLAAAGGVATLVNVPGSVGPASAWLAAGVALTAYSWRRFAAAIAALDASIGDEATVPAHGANRIQTATGRHDGARLGPVRRAVPAS